MNKNDSYYTLDYPKRSNSLPQYIISKEKRNTSSKLLTKRNYEKVTQSIEKFNSICKKINEKGYEDFCPKNFKPHPSNLGSKQIYLGTKEIECDKIVGDNWCNKPNFGAIKNKKSNYPKDEKFIEILKFFLGLEKPFRSLTLDYVILYENEYYTGEGNHRIYVSRLLGRKHIKSKIFQLR